MLEHALGLKCEGLRVIAFGPFPAGARHAGSTRRIARDLHNGMCPGAGFQIADQFGGAIAPDAVGDSIHV